MESAVKSDRIRSIDVFRGLTILFMIFVNDVAGVRNIPAWLKHAEAGSPGMTFVDVVFPAFLFIVGLAVPFALERRQIRYPGKALRGHIISRSLSLLVLGVLMLNGPTVNSMNKAWWNVLMYTGAILFWSDLPKKEGKCQWHTILKWSGFVLLVFLVLIFRRGDENSAGWFQTGWWGILGEIGFVYFCSALLYLFFKEKPGIFYIIPAFCVLLYIADRSGQLDFLGWFKSVFHPGSHLGTHVLIGFSGVICGFWLYRRKFDPSFTVLINMGLFALLLAVAAYALYGLYGIDKIAATPSWALLSTAICILIFIFIYWFMDVKKHTFIYGFFKPVAINPLLAYLLHVMMVYVFQLLGFSDLYGSALGSGAVGVLRSLLFTALIYTICAALTKAGLRLKL
jgi:heparan-alpha-glucosaminide N-acetyltransferase